MFRTRASLLRVAILWLLAVAIAMGAAIPKGWMPARAADDGFAVMICAQGMTIAEQEKVVAQLRATFGDALDQVEPADDVENDGEDSGDRCPYGVAAQAAAIAGSALEVIAAPARARDLLGSVAESTTGQGLAAPPPPATGPPATN